MPTRMRILRRIGGSLAVESTDEKTDSANASGRAALRTAIEKGENL